MLQGLLPKPLEDLLHPEGPYLQLFQNPPREPIEMAKAFSEVLDSLSLDDFHPQDLECMLSGHIIHYQCTQYANSKFIPPLPYGDRYPLVGPFHIQKNLIDPSQIQMKLDGYQIKPARFQQNAYSREPTSNPKPSFAQPRRQIVPSQLSSQSSKPTPPKQKAASPNLADEQSNLPKAFVAGPKRQPVTTNLVDEPTNPPKVHVAPAKSQPPKPKPSKSEVVSPNPPKAFVPRSKQNLVPSVLVGQPSNPPKRPKRKAAPTNLGGEQSNLPKAFVAGPKRQPVTTNLVDEPTNPPKRQKSQPKPFSNIEKVQPQTKRNVQNPKQTDHPPASSQVFFDAILFEPIESDSAALQGTVGQRGIAPNHKSRRVHRRVQVLQTES